VKHVHIYIPTFDRWNEQKTLESIPKKWLERTWLVVDYGEARHYRERYGDRVIVTPKHICKIATTRQWIMENPKDRYVVMLDDDLTFSMRKGKGIKLSRCEPEDLNGMFQLLRKWMKEEEYMHVGISRQGGNNHVEENHIDVHRMNNAYAYDAKRFREAGVRFDRLLVMEDFDVTLSLLRMGYPNRVTYKYAWSQKASGAQGGCSSYRTREVQADAARKLSELHPGCVRVVEKTSKSGWEGMKTRKDVVISWKKAYEHGKNKTKKGGISSFLKR